jgi:hypothetical protein
MPRYLLAFLIATNAGMVVANGLLGQARPATRRVRKAAATFTPCSNVDGDLARSFRRTGQTRSVLEEIGSKENTHVETTTNRILR